MSNQSVPQQRDKPFTQEELENFASFYQALKTVYVRLLSEGYTVRNGQFIPPLKREKPTST